MSIYLERGYTREFAYQSVGKGWQASVETCFDIVEMFERAATDATVLVVQVKEKLGGLRFYWEAHWREWMYADDDLLPPGLVAEKARLQAFSRAVNAAIHAIEQQTLTVCETCGQRGKQHTIGWQIVTACNICALKLGAEMIERRKSA